MQTCGLTTGCSGRFAARPTAEPRRWSEALLYPYNLTQLLISFGASCLINEGF